VDRPLLALFRGENEMIPVVDTHQHLWDLKQFSLPWLQGVEALNHNYRMDDYQRETAASGVAKTVYMEVDVAPEQRLLEAQFISELCARADNPMAGAVIAGSPGAEDFVHYIDQFQDSEYIKGIRQVLHVPEAERRACLQPRFVEGIQYLGELGKSFDLCLRPSELGDAVALVEQCPETLFILDHCGNADPQIVNGSAQRGKGQSILPRARAVVGGYRGVGGERQRGVQALWHCRARAGGLDARHFGSDDRPLHRIVWRRWRNIWRRLAGVHFDDEFGTVDCCAARNHCRAQRGRPAKDIAR
jgi:predicted TIM-barrel fold metal-dependent hydrolase